MLFLWAVAIFVGRHIAAAAAFLVPWRKLGALVASSHTVSVVCFLMGLGVFTFYAFSTGFNDAANFIRHSGADRTVMFLISATVFVLVIRVVVDRLNWSRRL